MRFRTPVTADQVKAHCAARIEVIMPSWQVAREMSGGKPVSDEAKAEAERLRQRCAEIEAMSPIPPNFTDDFFWSPRDE